jgi:DNA-binding NtrC family response regulator
VTGVRHPRQAIEVATFRTFQVAIIDSTLPEMNGVELMRRLRRLLGNVQVVIQACESRTAPAARSKGAFACLVKPCQQSLLESTVKDAFEHSATELPVGVDRQVPVIT